MSQVTIDTYIKQGQLHLDNLPFPDDTKVKVVVIPNLNLEVEKRWFAQIQALTQSSSDNWSEDIIQERHSS
ncbi:hypothetical protein THII_2543 [Thioploca ingrica]|jgi:hypothetical protein|uniref:Uncharacterized protein n=1 Tax=Thioploca ingrica TaxID=40754 RepID=A0A090ANC6_9GAMM|nr:hypothetical protein THII_2543 [Thioploca ingrica]